MSEKFPELQDPFTPEVKKLFNEFQIKISELAEIENKINSLGFTFPARPPRDYSKIQKTV